MTTHSPDRKAHSYLYHLEPIGVGTPEVESLTSYIARLASAHCLPVQPLLIEVLAPELEYSKINRSFSRFFKECACSLNGLGQYAEDFRSVLERLTLRTELSRLTMLPWKDVFDPGGKGLNKPHKAWCSSCLREWAGSGIPLREPLIWTLSSVQVCGRHGVGLRTSCPRCGEKQPVLARAWPIGYCSSCGLRLWEKEENEVDGKEELTEWNFWVIEEIGKLLSASPAEYGKSSHKGFQLAVAEVVRHLGIANTQDLDRAIGFGESTITQWRRGRGKPRFDYFLRFCFETGISPKEMLCRSSVDFLKYCRMPMTGEECSKERIHRKGEELQKEVREEMDRIFSSDEAPSLKEFSKKLGIGIGFLRYRFPEESKKIAARYRSCLREKKEGLFQERCEAIRKAVEELQRANEYPSKWKVFRRIPGVNPGGGKDKELTRVWKEMLEKSVLA